MNAKASLVEPGDFGLCEDALLEQFPELSPKENLKPRILVVDDNYFNLVAITSMLEQQQFECDSAMNGEYAINAVKDLYKTQKRTYNLILMDYKMPVYNGIQATLKIRTFLKETAPSLPKPYICCLTSYDEEELKKEALEAGMDAYTIKPIFKNGIQQLLMQAKLLQLN